MPSQFLNGTVQFDEVNNNSVKVTVKNHNLVVSGVYNFDDRGMVRSFSTDFRSITKNDGTLERRKWSAVYDNYTSKDGLVLPDKFMSTWHFDNEDLAYFIGTNLQYSFN